MLLIVCFRFAFNLEVSGQSTLSPNGAGVISTYARFVPLFQNGMLATAAALDLSGAAIAPAVDAKGGFYLSSPDLNCVYRIQADGHMYVAAGSATGTSGNSGDGGPATAALLSSPGALATDAQGNVFVSAEGGIHKINPAGTISTASPLSGGTIAVDAAGNLYLGGGAQVLKYSPGGVPRFLVVAGNGTSGFSGDGGPATAAAFSSIKGIAFDSRGNLFISDSGNRRVRKVTPDGLVTTFAGTGVDGFAGDGGPANQAQLSEPEGLGVDSAGNVYIADFEDHAVRKVDTNGVITTVAGGPSGDPSLFGGTPGGFSGDGGPAALAQLRYPAAVTADSAGNLYIVDSGNFRVREVTPDGLIHTVAGDGIGAGIQGPRPTYLAGDRSGNLYITGLIQSNVVYKIGPDGRRTVFAGNGTYGFADGVPALEAAFESPENVATDASGNVYISDSGNDRIRKVNTAGIVTTIAGNGRVGFSGDGGPATAASLTFPGAIVVDGTGTLYFSDSENFRIRKISPDGIITTIAGNGSTTFTGDGVATAVSVTANSLLIDASGALILSDGLRIRRLTADGLITTIAGTGTAGFNGDGPALSTSFFGAFSPVLDKANNIYFSDINNQRIRKLSPDGRVTTIAGGQMGYSGDGGPAILAQFWAPAGLVLDPAGVLFIADSFNGVIRSIYMQETAEFGLPPSTFATAQTAGTAAAPASGFASVTPYSGSGALSAMAILSFRANNVLVSEATVPASASTQAGRIRAEVNNQARTGLAIANPNNTPATIDFFFTDARGDFGNGELTLQANTHVAAFLDDPLFGAIGPIDGTYTFHASVPVAVTALRGLVNERSEFLMTTLPVVDLGAAPVAGTALIPHFASGGGWTTQVVLVNPTDTPLSGSIHFSSPAGDSASVNINGQNGADFAYSVPPRASQTLETSGSNIAAVETGSISITPTGGTGNVPDAMAIFSLIENGITVTAAGVPAVPAARRFGLYVEMAGALQAGIAIANPSAAPITVNLSLSSTSTAVQPEGSITIPAHGQIAAFLNQFPGLDALPLPYYGVLGLQSSAQFSVIGIRGRYNERNDFLTSTSMPVSEDPPPSASLLFIPDFADSGGFSTDFIVFNANATDASSGFITFFGDSGQGPVFSNTP